MHTREDILLNKKKKKNGGKYQENSDSDSDNDNAEDEASEGFKAKRKVCVWHFVSFHFSYRFISFLLA